MVKQMIRRHTTPERKDDVNVLFFMVMDKAKSERSERVVIYKRKNLKSVGDIISSSLSYCSQKNLRGIVPSLRLSQDHDYVIHSQQLML